MPSQKLRKKTQTSRRRRKPIEGGYRKVETPNPDLFVLRRGKAAPESHDSSSESEKGLLTRLSSLVKRSGLNKSVVFGPAKTKAKIYAYSIYSEDPKLILREDATGKQTLGRLSKGRFRPLPQGR